MREVEKKDINGDKENNTPSLSRISAACLYCMVTPRAALTGYSKATAVSRGQAGTGQQAQPTGGCCGRMKA